MSDSPPSLIDPTKLFLDIDTGKQYLEGSGLDSDMKSRPDLGADSCVGSGRLTGRRALVTGGDSSIDASVAIAFAREGADVAIVIAVLGATLPQKAERRLTTARPTRVSGRSRRSRRIGGRGGRTRSARAQRHHEALRWRRRRRCWHILVSGMFGTGLR